MNYTHLTREERYQIYALKKAGHNQREIAQVLKRSESTISRELVRNCGRRNYRPKQAYSKAIGRRSMSARTIDDATWQFAQGGYGSNGVQSKLAGTPPSARRRCINTLEWLLLRTCAGPARNDKVDGLEIHIETRIGKNSEIVFQLGRYAALSS